MKIYDEDESQFSKHINRIFFENRVSKAQVKTPFLANNPLLQDMRESEERNSQSEIQKRVSQE
jgi:hypothetical protein